MRNILKTVFYCITLAATVPSAYGGQPIEVYKNAN
jgi:hypothetical protein